MAQEHYSIMISSTYTELVDQRAAVSQAALGQDMFPLDMANDAALPDQDLIDASLAKVERADAYVGLISYRYGQMPECAVRNPDKLSLTELEFRRAKERGIPICMFIMSDQYPVAMGDVAKEAATLDKLKAFKALAKDKRIYAEFKSVDDLKAKLVQTLARLRTVLDKAKPPPVVTPPPPALDSPTPPAFHAKPPYLPGYKFQGRVKELAAIKDWAGSADPMLIFEAIGGMGKSMVTWEWVTNHAAKDRTDWAGILWYSFYERGADMRDFCVTALSYMTRCPREDLRTRPYRDLTDELLQHLRTRPWLLVLDGLERVLVAYNRSDAAQIRDDQVETSEGATGAAPTNCIRPDDDDLLRDFCSAQPSKILVSSRLMPRVLLNALGQPRPGVRRLQLLGLDPRDAEQMLRDANITGDSERMQQYLERHFGCHPLVAGVVGGLVRNNLRARGNFDRWVDDPNGGAAVNLADADIIQRRTHILKLAFDGLEPNTRDLLARIAMISNAVDLEVLEALNPVRPPAPKELKEPTTPDAEHDYWLDYLRQQLSEAKIEKQRADLEQQIANRPHERQIEYETARKAHITYQAAFTAWLGSNAVRNAPHWLNAALLDLETRGLLQCDRQAGKYDLHPVVRGYAVDSLSTEARAQTGQQVADYFSSRPSPPYEAATSLQDLANSIQIVQALNLAGKNQTAWEVLNGGLEDALFRLEHHHDRLALMRPLFPGGWSAPPDGVDNPGFVAFKAALDLVGIGLIREASIQEVFSIQEGARTGLSTVLSTALSNHSGNLLTSGEVARSERILALARDVAVAIANIHDTFRCDRIAVDQLISRGALAEARTHWGNVVGKLPQEVRHDGRTEAHMLLIETLLLLREGALTADALGRATARTQALRQPTYERTLLHIAGQWHQADARHVDAVEAYTRAIEMARAVGLRDTGAEAGRGLSLARLGRRPEAEDAAATAEHDSLHATVAELYLALEDHAKARHHAISGYKFSWADGPPYTFHWELQTCRTVLQALNESEPQLPPYDPTNIAPIKFEADIRRLLAEHAAKPKPPQT